MSDMIICSRMIASRWNNGNARIVIVFWEFVSGRRGQAVRKLPVLRELEASGSVDPERYWLTETPDRCDAKWRASGRADVEIR